MKSRFAVMSVLAICLCGNAAAQAVDDTAMQDFVDRVMAAIIVPAFERLDRETIELNDTVASLCASPDAAKLADADAAFADVAIAWAAVMPLQIQPMLTDAQRERFYFWPDPRGVTLRQIQPAIIDQDPTTTDPHTLRDKSVALQGLGALEYLLYGTGSEAIVAGSDAGRYRCAYAAAITTNLVALSEALADAVSPGGSFGALIAAPGADNPLYQSADDAVADIVLTAISAIELARDAFLAPILGDNSEQARPQLAPMRRAGLSLDFLDAIFRGSAALILGGDINEALPEDQTWITNSLRSEFDAARNAVPDAGIPIETAVAEHRSELELIGLIVDNLKALLGTNLTAALGLNLGFNSLDGD